MSAGEIAADKRSRVRGVRFPGKYLQGPGALEYLGPESKVFGSRAFCLLDRGIANLIRPMVISTFANNCEISLMTHGGDCTWSEIASVEFRATKFNSDCIVGLGGGKALDTAKAVADKMALPCIVVPTIAASDAPCSALAIIYNVDSTLDQAMHLKRNPDLVLVDTSLIAAAPTRFLAAGIADGLATCIEANACKKSGADNTFGLQGVALAYEIANLCEQTLFEFGEEAIAECDRGIPGAAMERVVEANILLSGLGFESCGVAAAHAIQDGLCELEETHTSLHGEKVAIGILGELKLQNVDYQNVQKFENFMTSIGLPTRLHHIGIPDVNKELLERVANRACRENDIMHNEPMHVAPEMVVRVLEELA